MFWQTYSRQKGGGMRENEKEIAKNSMQGRAKKWKKRMKCIFKHI